MKEERKDAMSNIIKGQLFKGHTENKRLYIIERPLRPGARLPVLVDIDKKVLVKGVGSMYTYVAMVDCSVGDSYEHPHVLIFFNTDNFSRYITDVRQIPIDFERAEVEVETRWVDEEETEAEEGDEEIVDEEEEEEVDEEDDEED